MALGYTVALREAQLDEIAAAIEAGAGAGVLKIYGDTRATDADTAVGAQTLLATHTLPDPVESGGAGTTTPGALTFGTISDDTNVDATEQANWFRIEDSNGNAVLDGDVGTSGSDLNFDTVAFVSGGTSSITSFVITAGNA
jgi:hypothetical protein